MSSFEEKGEAFWKWLETNGATLSKDITIKDYRSEGAGRGVVAKKDIKEGEILFSLPRSILLSQITSSLKDVEGVKENLNELPGWSPLILCMMYESQKSDSFWKPYFDVLPREFSTPMFWNEEDLKQLEGTDIIGKIGKEDAEATYRRDVKPFVEKYSNIFDKDVCNLELYHICGSLIMAYSFNDELQKTDRKKENQNEEDEEEEEDEDEEEEEEDQVLISMVPMADMLNHKTGYNNARLFHEPDSLQMRAIKDIPEGEQIYNTYGELCNADLLRKYGFTDEKNEFDIAEMDGKLVVDCCPAQDEEIVEKKIDFLMEEGAFDEVFVIDAEHEIPLELIVTVQVLHSTTEEFAKMEEKQKLPKPKLTKEVKETIQTILKKRLERYSTSLQEDVDELNNLSKEFSHKRNALLVRIGEKKIIQSTLKAFNKLPIVAPAPAANDSKKRFANNTKQSNSKKQKR